jgi:hypothetical protein
MAKRQCGTCRHFVQSEGSKHGWCNHPDRREATSMRILVRAGELRCRDDWGSDLWHVREPGDQVLDVSMMDDALNESADSHSARRIPPPTDHIVQPTAFQQRRPSLDPERTSLVSDDLNRELLRKAREQFRERQANNRYKIGATAEPESEPIVISNEVIPPSVETTSRPLRSQGLTEEPVRSMPPSLNFAPPKPAEPEWSGAAVAIDDIGPVDVLPPDRYHVDDPWRSGSRVEQAPRRSDPVWEREVPAMVDEPDAWDAVESKETSDSNYSEGTAVEPEYGYSDGVENADDLMWRDQDDSAVQIRREAARDASVWAGLIKCCATCRDFRPASGGGRGWCTNQWAFKHRRMVDADDRPCETSIGNWWIPGDFAWQGDLDVEDLAAATPLMDKWFGTSTGEEPEEAPALRRRRS